MKQNYILRLFLNLFKNPRVRVRKSSRLCHELGPIWGRRSAEQGGDWRPFCFFNTAWCCTFLSGYFCQFFNWLTFYLSARDKGKRQTRNWNTEERTKEGMSGCDCRSVRIAPTQSLGAGLHLVRLHVFEFLLSLKTSEATADWSSEKTLHKAPPALSALWGW